MGKGWLLSPTANIWPFKLLVCLPPSLSSLSLFVENRKEQSRVNPLSLLLPWENSVKVTSETNLLQLEKQRKKICYNWKSKRKKKGKRNLTFVLALCIWRLQELVQDKNKFRLLSLETGCLALLFPWIWTLETFYPFKESTKKLFFRINF